MLDLPAGPALEAVHVAHADLELDVTKSSLRAESKTHKLAIFLPMPVDSDQGKAKWDAKKDTLTVTLPIIRDEW